MTFIGIIKALFCIWFVVQIILIACWCGAQLDRKHDEQLRGIDPEIIRNQGGDCISLTDLYIIEKYGGNDE